MFAAVKSIQMINNLSSLFIQPSSVESCQNDLFLTRVCFSLFGLITGTIYCPGQCFAPINISHIFFCHLDNLTSQLEPCDDEAPRINWT